MSIAVIGSGAFGTALAISLCQNGAITLWSRSKEQAANLASERENRARLPGMVFPDNLVISSDLPLAASKDILLLAVPMQQIRGLLNQNKDMFTGRQLVACCKGIELKTGVGPITVMSEALQESHNALLTGPSFASDIARGQPTALTLACADDAIGRRLQHALTTANLRLYRTTDTVGAELGGALKNVMAIACGAVMGANLGESARAAIMTRGYAEMQRMALVLGAEPETLAGLCGFGDLALTCTSEQSRNYQLGLSLGRGHDFDPGITVEGAATARAVADKAVAMKIDMPITNVVVGMLDGKLKTPDAMAILLSRPLKEE